MVKLLRGYARFAHILAGEYLPGGPEELRGGGGGGHDEPDDEHQEGSGHVLHRQRLGLARGGLPHRLRPHVRDHINCNSMSHLPF